MASRTRVYLRCDAVCCLSCGCQCAAVTVTPLDSVIHAATARSATCREDPSVVRNYGSLMIELAASIPDGIVCFFTSYRCVHSLYKQLASFDKCNPVQVQRCVWLGVEAAWQPVSSTLRQC
jgi:hypothetical protein